MYHKQQAIANAAINTILAIAKGAAIYGACVTTSLVESGAEKSTSLSVPYLTNFLLLSRAFAEALSSMLLLLI